MLCGACLWGGVSWEYKKGMVWVCGVGVWCGCGVWVGGVCCVRGWWVWVWCVGVVCVVWCGVWYVCAVCVGVLMMHVCELEKERVVSGLVGGGES